MEKFYIRINKYMLSHKKTAKLITLLDRLITLIMLLFYPGFLLWLFFNDTSIFIIAKCIIVPAIGFTIVSVGRIINKSPRPYELYEIEPINGKTTVNRSFPSRHVFSIFMIAEVYLYIMDSPSALILYALGILLALTRVLMGVHFIKDVFAGGFFALVCGMFLY